MIYKHRRALWRVAAFGATILFVLFIFSNSMQVSTASSARSSGVVELLQAAADALHLPIVISETVIRKLAHFCEYLVLGLLLCVDIRLLTKNWWARVFAPLFFGLLIPVADECIQLFTPGRSSEVLDVLLDFGGVVCGLLILTPILAGLERRKKGN